LNKKSIGANKKFQSGKNLLNVGKCHIHNAINQENIGRLITSDPSYLDQYLSGANEMHIHFGWLDRRPVRTGDSIRGEVISNYCVILQKIFPFSQGLVVPEFNVPIHTEVNGKFPPATTNSNKLTMLISVFEAVDDSQDVAVSISPLLVRLQIYDECPSLRVQSFGGGLEIFPCTGILDHELSIFVLSEDVLKQDWKTRMFSALFRDTTDNNVIKCTSQVMYEITEHDGNHRVRLLSDVEAYPDCILAIRQPDTFEIVRVAFCVPHGFLVDVYHVLPSPLELEPPVIHMLNSEYEEGKSEDAKDTKRTRDSHTNARRVRTESKKGNKSRQINPSQPEEVTTQTSPDHHHGGYNAKNTHLGSPEDV
jgi:hypothetical protein